MSKKKYKNPISEYNIQALSIIGGLRVAAMMSAKPICNKNKNPNYLSSSYN